MRLIQRRALIVAVAVALVSSLVVLPSVASAAKSKGPTLKSINKRVTTLSQKLNTVSSKLANVTGTVNQGIPIITQLVSGLTAAGNGLKALQAAVSDPTTGLPGLNAARSLVGAVVSNAAATGSEFTVTRSAAGTYILSFVNGASPPAATDVSKRTVVITPFPNPGHFVTASAVNCSVATNPCTTADTKATDELILTQQDGGAVPVDENFSVAAISG